MDLADLAWEEARRLLVRQEADLDTLHTRSLAVLSAAAITGGLFAGGLGGHRNSPQLVFLVLALVCFAATAFAVVFIQWPRKWDFAHDELPSFFTEISEKGRLAKAVNFSYNMAVGFDGFRRSNQGKIERLYKVFTTACILLGAQVVFWGLTVAT